MPVGLEKGSNVTLGIINREGRDTDYAVVVRVLGEADTEIARISLQPEAVWE